MCFYILFNQCYGLSILQFSLPPFEPDKANQYIQLKEPAFELNPPTYLPLPERHKIQIYSFGYHYGLNCTQEALAEGYQEVCE